MAERPALAKPTFTFAAETRPVRDAEVEREVRLQVVVRLVAAVQPANCAYTMLAQPPSILLCDDGILGTKRTS